LLSSKEKDVWICECGKVIDIAYKYCHSCEKDIYGFRATELAIHPPAVREYIKQKIDVIRYYLTE
jgi:hypothetical protein